MNKKAMMKLPFHHSFLFASTFLQLLFFCLIGRFFEEPLLRELVISPVFHNLLQCRIDFLLHGLVILRHNDDELLSKAAEDGNRPHPRSG